VLSGSEKDPEGGDKNGGGNGLGALLANNAKPVSNLNGQIAVCRACAVGATALAAVEDAAASSGWHRGGLWRRERRG
jgi:hypothetical protein